MTNLSTTPDNNTIEQVILGGDLAALSPSQRMAYYGNVCSSLGLNPLTRPFQYIRLNNKLVLYATRDCTDQLRNLNGISIQITGRELINDDVYLVTAMATKGERSDESVGAVSITGLKGEAKANALMRAETKAKRRVTLSINGLGMLDETEVGTIPDAPLILVDHQTGEITGPAPVSLPAPTAPGVPPPTGRRPQRPAPRSSPGKLEQLDQARYDSSMAEVYTPEEIVNYVCSNYAERGPRELVDAEIDEVIQAALTGQIPVERRQPRNAAPLEHTEVDDEIDAANGY